MNPAYAEADAVMRTYNGIVVAFVNLQKQRACNRVWVIRYRCESHITTTAKRIKPAITATSQAGRELCPPGMKSD